ncbi:MAG: hypothetical protein ACLT98_15325 [Eggerthellaceae bacterium]
MAERERRPGLGADQGPLGQGRLPVASDAAGAGGAKDGFAVAPPDDDGASGEGRGRCGRRRRRAASTRLAVSADEVPAVKVTVGPWFARLDAGASTAPRRGRGCACEEGGGGAGEEPTAAWRSCALPQGRASSWRIGRPAPVPRGGRAKASSATVRKPVVTTYSLMVEPERTPATLD